MSPQSERGSYEENRENEVEMKESNKRDRGDISIESVEDDQKSPSHKKQRISKDAEKRMCQDIMALSKLLEKAVEDKEKKETISLIGCYIPICRDCPDQAIGMMNKISTGWTERKEKFIEAINFVRCGGVEETLENESIEDLSEILCTEILGRMSNFCNQCGDYYFVEKEEMEPKIKCIRCKVSRHNCDSKTIDMNVVGMHWFCDECDEHFMTEYISKFDKNAHFKGFKENEKNKETKITKKDDTTKIKDKKTEESEKTTPEGDNDESEEIPKQIPNKEQKKEIADQSKEKKEKCPYWENNDKCKFGEICRLEHENKCKNIMENGECNNRRTCDKKHPKVCYDIQFYNYCARTDKECKFVHPKNKQRGRVRERNPGNNYGNYGRYQETTEYNDEDFFGYNQRPWNVERQMRRGVRGPEMYPHPHPHQYRPTYQHAYEYQHRQPYPPYHYIY